MWRNRMPEEQYKYYYYDGNKQNLRMQLKKYKEKSNCRLTGVDEDSIDVDFGTDRT